MAHRGGTGPWEARRCPISSEAKERGGETQELLVRGGKVEQTLLKGCVCCRARNEAHGDWETWEDENPLSGGSGRSWGAWSRQEWPCQGWGVASDGWPLRLAPGQEKGADSDVAGPGLLSLLSLKLELTQQLKSVTLYPDPQCSCLITFASLSLIFPSS